MSNYWGPIDGSRNPLTKGTPAREAEKLFMGKVGRPNTGGPANRTQSLPQRQIRRQRWLALAADLDVSTMTAKRKRTLLAVGMLLGVTALALARFRLNAPVVVSVGFIGYTNGVTGERLAGFGITNRSRATVRRWGHFDLEVRKSPLLAYTRTIGSHAFLAPGQAEVVFVPLDAEPAFSYQNDWRAVFYWRKGDLKTRFDIWADTSPWLPAWLKGRGVRVYRAPSQWMDQ